MGEQWKLLPLLSDSLPFLIESTRGPELKLLCNLLVIVHDDSSLWGEHVFKSERNLLSVG